jgi:hypothetical protein
VASVAQLPTTGVFLARAWREDGQFRARISYQLITGTGVDEEHVLTADVDEVRRHLELWLERASTVGLPDDPAAS